MKRRWIQLASALIYNANLKGFGEAAIYQGKTKGVCVPGLNCYSCPGAIAACPLEMCIRDSILIEAMADAAVADGMPRPQAYKFAAQAVMGSAKMVLETGKHPGELKDMVCSPAGTTIEAVRVLERTGFRSSVIEAMKACADIAKRM